MQQIDIYSLQRQERLKKAALSSSELDTKGITTVRKILITVFKPLLKDHSGIYITNDISEEMSGDDMRYYVEIKRKGVTIIRKNSQKKDTLFFEFKTGVFTINDQTRDAKDAQRFVTLIKNISRDVAAKKATVFEEKSA